MAHIKSLVALTKGNQFDSVVDASLKLNLKGG